MQAQASKTGAGDGAPASPLQNPKVQIAIIAAGAIALIVAIWLFFFSAPPAPDAVAVNPSGGPGGYPMGMPGGDDPPAGMPGAAPGMPGGYPGMPGAAPAMPGAAPAAAPGAAPATPGGEAAAKAKGPGVGTRANPFAPNTEIAKALTTIPKPVTIKVPEQVAPELPIYQELNPPKPVETVGAEENDGPPIPAMRVAGVIFGSAAGPTATIQIGSEYFQATPGKMLPDGNPIYRVERIEQDRVILTRRWEMGDKKGTQRIEVSLAGSAGSPGGGAFGGAMGGYPGGGYPGGGFPN